MRLSKFRTSCAALAIPQALARESTDRASCRNLSCPDGSPLPSPSLALLLLLLTRFLPLPILLNRLLNPVPKYYSFLNATLATIHKLEHSDHLSVLALSVVVTNFWSIIALQSISGIHLAGLGRIGSSGGWRLERGKSTEGTAPGKRWSQWPERRECFSSSGLWKGREEV